MNCWQPSTAGIDNTGAVPHINDVVPQQKRALKNICALLKAAGSTLAEMAYFILYTRNPSEN